MGLLNRLFGLGQDPQTKAYPAARIDVWPQEYKSGHPQPFDLHRTLTAYEKHVWVYACQSAIARCCARIPFKILRGEAEASPKDRIAQPFYSVNPFMSQADLVEMTVLHLLGAGNAYWALEIEAMEIWPLNPYKVKIIPDADTFVAGYKYSSGTKTITFDVSEMVHFKLPNPNDPWYGMSPLQAAFDSVTADVYAIQEQRDVARRGYAPRNFISSPHKLTPEQKTDFDENFKRRYSGPAGRNKIPILSGGMELKTLGVSAKDAEIISQRKLNREEICGAFGVPPVIAGLFEYARYANADIQERLMWRNTVMPMSNRIVMRLNDSYALPTGYTAELDTTGFEGLVNLTTPKEEAELAEKRTAALVQVVGLGAQVTTEEAREAAGLDPEVPEGEVLERAAPAASPFALSAGQPKLKGLDANPELLFIYGRDLKGPRKMFATPTYDGLRLDFMLGIKPGLQAMRAAVIKRLAAIGISKGAGLKVDAVDIQTAIRRGYTEDAELLREYARPSMELTLDSAVTITAARAGVDPSLIGMDRAEDWLEYRANLFAVGVDGKGGVTQTIQARLERSLADGLAAEESNTQLIQRVMVEFHESGAEITPRAGLHRDWPSHAQMIVDEETKAAGRWSGQMVADEAGFSNKTWNHSSASDDPRPDHEAMDGETVPLWQAFSNGMMVPGDSAIAEDVINCSCYVTYGIGV